MKRLVICCDGTWNRADQVRDGEPCPTNVVKLAYRIAKRDPAGTAQVVMYSHGVGTGNVLDRYSGGAFGAGLEDNIHEAYRFLVGNYELGDEIFVFGFSRGAFTARSLVGMIRNCGILTRNAVAHYRAAIELYRDDVRGPKHPFSIDFKQRYSVCSDGDVPVRFIGVWDTVGALGIPLAGLRWFTRRKQQFHDTQLSGIVEIACHALAIDERRAPFAPALWDAHRKPGQSVRQVWFCGVHSDVGGGYPGGGLSDISLQWMINAATDAGLAFDDDLLRNAPLTGTPTATLHNSRKGIYRFARGIDRRIGGDETQSLHPSVLERWDADPRYRPPNLQQYITVANPS